ncbi:LOW QUALITY PROTEIN: hypothetical protein HJFPF1_03209 [Paramyrothecium foliicola]|nr:LOW QUALITY PROTEIN: hypothetical protein HJFPF1_03209 [Paramyrothecium foliicola]
MVEQLRALSGQTVGQPPKEKAKGHKKKAKQAAPGEGKSKFAIARREKALQKAAEKATEPLKDS